ncbi:MAG: hypothetical protein WD403_02505 [Pirellulales bacterium]
MKTVTISPQATEVNSLLEQARNEDILVRAADGTEFVVSAVNEFEYEIARTRQNAKLMAILDERAKQEQTISLDEVKRRLGLRDDA